MSNPMMAAAASAATSKAVVASLIIRRTSSAHHRRPASWEKNKNPFSGLSSLQPSSVSFSSSTVGGGDIAVSVAQSRSFATSSAKANARTGRGGAQAGGDADAAATTTSYFGRKAVAKELRVQSYRHKLERADQLKHRRRRTVNAAADEDHPGVVPNNNMKKDAFRSWWDTHRAHEERLDRKARQAGLQWKVQVAVIVERLPVVLPDKEDYERDFEQLQAYIQAHSGKEYPKEFVGGTTTGSGDDRPVALTDEELIALLPESYKPAPRETKADNDGTLSTLDRRLKESVYLMLMIDDEQQHRTTQPFFPTTFVRDHESLVEAAMRALQEHIGTKGIGSGSGAATGRKSNGEKTAGDGDKVPPMLLPLDLYYPSQAPLGVHLQPYVDDRNKDDDDDDDDDDDVDDKSQQVSSSEEGYFGTKTFFIKVQYDDGMLTKKDIGGGRDFAWLDRAEVVDHFRAGGMTDNDAKFYRYLL